jgi:ketosteroid isomerase-like protein
MRRVALVLGVAVTISLASGVAQRLAADQADVEKVRAANQAFYEAFSAKDLQKVEQLWAHEPYVRALGPRSQDFRTGWEGVRGHWQEVFTRFEQVAIAMEGPQIQVRDRVAWVSGLEKLEGRLAGGQTVTVVTLATRVLEKKGDAWLTVHHHGSAQPK